MPFRVFYLDDEVDLCQVFSENFQAPGVEITLFSDPVKAIEVISASPPDLFFVDYRLPGMTGEDVARRVGPSVPTILLTGDLEVSPADIYLKKFSKQPFPFEEIEAIIAAMAEGKTV